MHSAPRFFCASCYHEEPSQLPQWLSWGEEQGLPWPERFLKSVSTRFHRVGIPNLNACWCQAGDIHGRRGLGKTVGSSGGCNSLQLSSCQRGHVKMQSQRGQVFPFSKEKLEIQIFVKHPDF